MSCTVDANDHIVRRTPLRSNTTEVFTRSSKVEADEDLTHGRIVTTSSMIRPPQKKKNFNFIRITRIVNRIGGKKNDATLTHLKTVLSIYQIADREKSIRLTGHYDWGRLYMDMLYTSIAVQYEVF